MKAICEIANRWHKYDAYYKPIALFEMDFLLLFCVFFPQSTMHWYYRHMISGPIFLCWFTLYCFCQRTVFCNCGYVFLYYRHTLRFSVMCWYCVSNNHNSSIYLDTWQCLWLWLRALELQSYIASWETFRWESFCEWDAVFWSNRIPPFMIYNNNVPCHLFVCFLSVSLCHRTGEFWMCGFECALRVFTYTFHFKFFVLPYLSSSLSLMLCFFHLLLLFPHPLTTTPLVYITITL